MNQELDNYVKAARATGQTDEQIKQALVKSGWSQVQINEAFGIPNPSVVPAPVAPNAVPPPPVGAANPMGDFLDQKTKETMIWSAVGYGAKGAIVAIAGAIVTRMMLSSYLNVYGASVYYGKVGFGMGNIIITIIWSIIIGAIIGAVLAKFYPQIQKINQQFFKGWFNTLFKLLFYPAVVGSILAMFLTGGFSALFGSAFGASFGNYFFMSSLVTIVAELVGSFIYAKVMVMKIDQYFSR